MHKKRSQHEPAGTNMLRGGRNQYSSRTKLGNWVEEEYNPLLKPNGFPGGQQFRSTTREMQEEGAGIHREQYGGALRSPIGQSAERFDYNNIINADRTQTSEKWKTVTAASFADPANPEVSEFGSSFKLKGGMPPAEMEAYRERWTKETPVMSQVRYQTEKQTAYGVNPLYRTQVLRWLPGAPPSVEKLREKVLANYCYSDFCNRVQSLCGPTITLEQYTALWENIQIRLSEADREQTWSYLTRGKEGPLETQRFLDLLRGPAKPQRLGAIERVYQDISRLCGGNVTIAALFKLFDASRHPDVRRGATTEDAVRRNFRTHPLWEEIEKARGGKVQLEDFRKYCEDISCLVFDDEAFQLTISKCWEV